MKESKIFTACIKFVYDIYVDGEYRASAILDHNAKKEEVIQHIYRDYRKGSLHSIIRSAFLRNAVEVKLNWSGVIA